MYKLARHIVNTVVDGFRGNSSVVGIVVYGSIGRGDEDRYSDIDMAIYVKSKESYTSTFDKLYEILSSIDKDVYVFRIKDKHVFVLMKKNIWIEVRIRVYSDVVNDIIYIVQSRIEDPSKAVVYDPYGVLLSLIKMNWFAMDEPDVYKEEINHLTYGFLYYIKLYIHYAVYRKDSFRAYMNYTIALYKLAGLIAALYGEEYNLYGPWHLFERVVKDTSLSKRFYKLASNYAGDPNYNISEIISFLESMTDIAYKYGNKYVGDSIKSLIDIINKLITL